MLELRTLGVVALHDERGGLLAVPPKALALLVYLALARPRGPQRRDTLQALFNPELDQRHARMALRQLVHRLRAAAGDDVLRSDRQTVALEPDRLTCDVHSFEAALAAADQAKAVAVYSGPFLPGFFLSGCPEFERWVEAERSRLERAYTGALERLALEADAGGDAERAVSLWQQLAEVDPYATRVTVRLIAALEAAGDRAGALKVAESHAQRLKQELDAEPSPEVEALARRLRVQPVPSTPVPGGSTRERLARAVAGRYRVDRVAGAGGMALVYLAEDMKLGRPVALKVLRPELAAAIGHERFLNEIDIAASLAHPNILPLHDAGEADGLVYYVMPYVEGESLRARLAREGPLQLAEAVRITREVADALGHAHERGIVHRDIKPANILLLADHAVVSDFGVALALGNAVEDRALVATTGTPAYMSPEQAAGSPDVDARSDLYSLGCVLHEMLTGAPPEREYETQAVLAATSPEGETVPATVEAALAKALAPVPAERFGTAAEFGAALSVESVGVSRRVGVRRIGSVVAAAVVFVSAALAAWRYMPGAGPLHITVSNLRQVTRAPEIEIHPAFSPDGREVAYSSGVGRQWHLAVVDLESGLSFPFSADPAEPRTVPRWMPDGSGIVFHQGYDVWSTTSHLIPRHGGPMTTVVDARVWDVSNDRIVYTDPEGLFVRNVAGGKETLVTRHSPEAHSAVWSPDGSMLAYVQGNDAWIRGTNLGNVSPSSIWIVSAAGGVPVQVTDSVHLHVSPAWMPDGRHLLFVSDRDGTRDIYAVQLDRSGRPRNRPERLTTALHPHSISVSADGSRLVCSIFTMRQNVWAIRIPETGSASLAEAKRVTSENQVVEHHGISRDGRWLAFDSNREGNQDIYVVPAAGGVPRRLTDDAAADYHPDFSPDGTEIVFYSIRHGSRDVFLMSADGSHEVRLTTSPARETHPSFSPDGLHIAFDRRDSVRTDISRVFVMSRDSIGGEWTTPHALTPNVSPSCIYPRWSPDGSQLSCWGFPGVRLVSLQGAMRVLLDSRAVGLLGVSWPDWSPDGRTLYLQGVDSTFAAGLYAFDVQRGTLRQVIRFDDPTKDVNYAHTIADGTVYFSVREIESDIWMLDLEW